MTSLIIPSLGGLFSQKTSLKISTSLLKALNRSIGKNYIRLFNI